MSATKAGYSAAELAGLPGMPSTKRGVRLKAEAEGWAFDEEGGQGGTRRMYRVESLPAATVAALRWNKQQIIVTGPSEAAKAGRVEGARLELQSTLDAQAADARRLEGLKQSTALPPSDQRRIDAKLELVRAFEIFAAGCELPLKQARFEFARAYNAATIVVPGWAREVIASVSAASIERWQADIKTRGITALAGAYGNRKGASKIDGQPPLRDLVVGMLVRYPHARATHVMQSLRARFADGSADLPSMRSLERWMADWRAANKQTLTALSNPDAWKNKFMVSFGSQSEGITRLNQLWELDSTPGDVMLLDGRHQLIGGIDVYSRRPKLYVTKTSKATAVATLVRHMLLDFGVPEGAKTDNGSDYTSHHLTRVFAGLDIEHELCPPFQPWHKPHIERFFGTFTRDLVELLGGFIGHSVAERQAIEARKSFADRLLTRGAVVEISMTSEDFQAFCDRWISDVYMHRPHDGLEQRTPFEAATSWGLPVRRINDERVLDILLAEAPENNGRRTVQKKGIALDSAWFIAPELEAFVGESVQVRLDPVDLGRIYVFGGAELKFLCIAECPERTGMNRKEVAAKARELQKARVQDERRALKAAAKKANTDDIVEEILRDRAQAAGKLKTLPRKAEQHTSAGIEAAAEAVAERDRLSRDEQWWAAYNEQQRAHAQQLADKADIPRGTPNELAERRAAVLGGIETPEFANKHERVQWLLQQQHVRELSGEERESLALYKRENPAAYRRIAETVDMQFGQLKNSDPAATGSQ